MKIYRSNHAKAALKKPRGLIDFDALIQAGKESPHRSLTRKVLAGIWQRGHSLVRQREQSIV
jgi:hypothetical protein